MMNRVKKSSPNQNNIFEYVQDIFIQISNIFLTSIFQQDFIVYDNLNPFGSTSSSASVSYRSLRNLILNGTDLAKKENFEN